MDDKELKNGNKSLVVSTNTKQTTKDEQGQISDVIGHFGKYQFLIFMFKILIGVVSAFNNLGVTFFAPKGFIGFTCLDESPTALMNSTASMLTNSTLGLLLEDQRGANFVDDLEHSTKSLKFSEVFQGFLNSEERKHRHSVTINTDNPEHLKKECTYISKLDGQEKKCKKFKYDKTIWLSTIIDEWQLICDRSWWISITQSLYMTGFIFSFLTFGYISDRFGRWIAMLIGATIEVGSGFGCSFATSVTWFVVFRFLLGLGNAGRTTSTYLIMIEWVGPKWRMQISTLGSLGWAFGYSVMPWIALYFVHFRHLQLFVCFYELIFVIVALRIPESPRWLLTHRRFDEAYQVLLTAAKFNGLIKEDKYSKITTSDDDKKSIPPVDGSSVFNINRTKKPSMPSCDLESSKCKPGELQPYTMDEFEIKFQQLVETTCAKEFTKNEAKLSVVDLFKWKNLRKYALILFFVWSSSSFIYYGIALSVGDFGGKNLFISFTIAGLFELPSIAFSILCMKLLPRKTTNLFIFITCGFLFIIQLPIKYYDLRWLQQCTMMLAKLFNSCSFTCFLYQTMELFPTSIRQTAYSSCSLAGRIGSILAPFIVLLEKATNKNVTPIMFTALSFMAALLVTELPETKGLDLPDTLLEAEKTKGIDKATKDQINNQDKAKVEAQ